MWNSERLRKTFVAGAFVVGIAAGAALLAATAGCGGDANSSANHAAVPGANTGVAAPATTADPNASAAHAQTNCPIMGGKISKAIFVDYQGKRVYFCCGGCPAEFKKDPAKYVKAMEDTGVVLDKTPAPAPPAG